jgi:hypothetical protein
MNKSTLILFLRHVTSKIPSKRLQLRRKPKSTTKVFTSRLSSSLEYGVKFSPFTYVAHFLCNATNKADSSLYRVGFFKPPISKFFFVKDKSYPTLSP